MQDDIVRQLRKSDHYCLRTGDSGKTTVNGWKGKKSLSFKKKKKAKYTKCRLWGKNSEAWTLEAGEA